MKIKYNVIILLILFAYNYSFSQNNVRLYSYGLNGAYILSQNRANFKTFGNYESCCNQPYLNSTSNNFQFGIFYIDNLYNNLNYYISLSYVNYQDDFNISEQILTQDGFATIQYNENLNLNTIQNILGLNYKIKRIGITLGLVTEVNLNKTYNVYEEMKSPPGSKFENGKTVRNEFYDVDAVYIKNWNFGISSMFAYDVYLDNRGNSTLSPFIRLDYMFSNYHINDELYKFNLIFGLSYKINKFKQLDSPIEPK